MMKINPSWQKKLKLWREDWCLFAKEVLKARLDEEQKAILRAVQTEKMVAVASGTARGKDYIAAVAAMCFMYLTPRWDKHGNLVKNTKVAMTAPTDRQVRNIMVPEVRRLYRNAGCLPGRIVGHDIRTRYEEWFLTGFKAGDDNQEAWSGFHAVNTMFVVTEASGISQTTYNAIEGNLQGNSRLLIVFNPNTPTGYAAHAMKSGRFKKFRLSSLNAENVIKKQEIIPGQVNYEWVKDKVEAWCTPIQQTDFNEGDGDFKWEGGLYRPNDLFRIKVLGMFPKVAEDVLIPYEWLELAFKRWEELNAEGFKTYRSCKLGVDVAGMGRDSSILVPRFGNWIPEIISHHSGGRANHMHIAGMAVQYLRMKSAVGFIDTIGEGAGTYSRLIELGYDNAFSCKFSYGAKNLNDVTGQYTFANMRAYLYWAVRDWLNPKNNNLPAIPPNEKLMEEATEIKWFFQSNGSIAIEKKDDIKKRLKRSPDTFDALANTFFPYDYVNLTEEDVFNMFL